MDEPHGAWSFVLGLVFWCVVRCTLLTHVWYWQSLVALSLSAGRLANCDASSEMAVRKNILVHALEGPGTKAGRTQKKSSRPGTDPRLLFLGPGLGPWPLQCMHKSVVHAQECCACTRILCMHKNLDKQDVPRRTKTYQDVPRRTKTYQEVGTADWLAACGCICTLI